MSPTISFKSATDLQIDHCSALAEAVMVMERRGIGRVQRSRVVLKRRPADSQGRDCLEDGLDAVAMLRCLNLVPGVTRHLLQLQQTVAVGMFLTFEQPVLLPFHLFKLG